MGRIIAVANQKGGVGKTTTAVNLSAALAVKGQKVLLIDSDPQGNATSGVGVDKNETEYSLYDVLINNISVKDAVVQTETENLSLLPSNINLVGAEIEMVSLISRETVLARALKKVQSDYNFIIIDCPPSLGLLTLNTLAAAEQVLIPIQCEYYALEGLSQLVNTIKLVKTHINSGLEIEGVLLTMYDSRTNLSFQVVDEVKKYFKHKVHSMVIPRNVRLGEAPSFGKPICKYDAKCAGAVAYDELAEEVMEGI